MLVELFAAGGIAGVWLVTDGGSGPVAYRFASMLTLALPFAVLPATTIVLARRQLAPADARLALTRAVLLTVLVLVPLSGWITPASNQSYREAVFRATSATADPPKRGIRELTLPELAASMPPSDFQPGNVARGRELQGRLSLMALPITLTALGFALGALPTMTIARAALIWVATVGVVVVGGVATENTLAKWELAVGFWPLHGLLLLVAARARYVAQRSRGADHAARPA
jgi:hypothetical protein